MSNKFKILILDLETAPLMAMIWKMWKENVSLDQLVDDSYILSYCAKWHGEKHIYYEDQRGKRNKEDDKKIVKNLRKLVDQADLVIAHNGKNFDLKVLNARLLHHRLPPPSSYKTVDTLEITKKHFRLPSYKLEYLTNKFNTRYKKLKHKNFPGFMLWRETVLNDNPKAWVEMEKYNLYDVLALEELYFDTLFTWDNSTNYFNYQSEQMLCRCGTNDFKRNGIYRTPTRQYQRYKCNLCGYEWRGTKSLKSVVFTNTTRN